MPPPIPPEPSGVEAAPVSEPCLSCSLKVAVGANDANADGDTDEKPFL